MLTGSFRTPREGPEAVIGEDFIDHACEILAELAAGVQSPELNRPGFFEDSGCSDFDGGRRLDFAAIIVKGGLESVL